MCREGQLSLFCLVSADGLGEFGSQGATAWQHLLLSTPPPPSCPPPPLPAYLALIFSSLQTVSGRRFVFKSVFLGPVPFESAVETAWALVLVSIEFK